MAVFQFNNRTIPYRIALGPFHFDLVLLQGAKFDSTFWNPTLETFKDRPYAGGRILVCDWFDPKVEDKQLAADFVKLMQTLALVSVRVVAFDEAVEMVAYSQNMQPRLFERTLFFPEGGPKGDALNRAVMDLCQI